MNGMTLLPLYFGTGGGFWTGGSAFTLAFRLRGGSTGLPG